MKMIISSNHPSKLKLVFLMLILSHVLILAAVAGGGGARGGGGRGGGGRKGGRGRGAVGGDSHCRNVSSTSSSPWSWLLIYTALLMLHLFVWVGP